MVLAFLWPSLLLWVFQSALQLMRDMVSKALQLLGRVMVVVNSEIAIAAVVPTFLWTSLLLWVFLSAIQLMRDTVINVSKALKLLGRVVIVVNREVGDRDGLG